MSHALPSYFPPPAPPGPFSMPMCRDFVPRRLRPWLYVCFVIMFQFTGGMYLSQSAQMVGDLVLTAEDIMMCTYCGLVGIILPFPLLFRFKFRFTNRQILLTACTVIALCNVAVLYVDNIVLLCAICFIAGFMKLCGTFECFSNIQLWMTPSRDFGVFFPVLYCVVLGDIQFSGLVSTHLSYLFTWQEMHYLVAGVMAIQGLLIFFLTRDFRFMKPLPLYGIDVLGIFMWSAVLTEIVFIFTYGEHYNWWDGAPIRMATYLLIATLALSIWRMMTLRHPYLQPQTWRFKQVGIALLLFLILELLITPTHALGGMMGHMLGHGTLTHAMLNGWTLLGVVIGAAVSFLWIKVMRMSYIHLTGWAFLPAVATNVWFYFFISPEMNVELFYLPSVCCGASQTIIYVTLTIYLEEHLPLMNFFQSLTIVGMIRTSTAMAICGAIYAFWMRYSTAEQMVHITRFVDHTTLSQTSPTAILPYYGRLYESALWIGARQLFGWVTIFGLGFLLTVLLYVYDTPVRSTLKRMPDPVKLGYVASKRFRRIWRKRKQALSHFTS